MKVLIFKLCNNIRYGGKEKNGGQSEIFVTIDLLKQSGHQIGILTIERYHQFSPKDVECFDWSEESIQKIVEQYDAILFFNGQFNPFGGKISKETEFSYKLLNRFKKSKVMCVTDTIIPLGDAARWIRANQDKGKCLEYNVSHFEVDYKNILCLSQTFPANALLKMKGWENEFGGYLHFPFETTVLFRKNLIIKMNEKPLIDLIYFGNMRSGKRNKKFIKFYCGHPSDMRVDVYGNWDETKLKVDGFLPTFRGPIEMSELHSKINSSYAHCYISDPQNEGVIWTTRLYEAVLNQCVLFIDRDNDPNIIKFNSFFYVGSRSELEQKIRQIKSDGELRCRLLNIQMDIMSRAFNDTKVYPTLLNHVLSRAKEYAKNI